MGVHTAVQDALLHDDLSDEVVDHVAACRECAAFCADLDRLASAARRLHDDGVPADVLARLTDRVGREPVTNVVALRRSARRAVVRIVAAAAVLALVVAGLAVVGGDSAGDPADALLVAATRTEEAGTARIEVQALGQVTVDPGARRPDFSRVPPEMAVHLEDEWNRTMAEFEARVNATLDNADRMIDDAIDEAFDNFDRAMADLPAGRRPASPPDAAADAPPSGSDSPTAGDGHGTDGGGGADDETPAVSVGFDVNATGAASFGEGVRLQGNVRAGTATTPFELAAANARTALRVGNEPWLALPQLSGPLAAAVIEAESPTRLVRAATGVGRVGPNRFRFTIEGGRGEARIDDDGRITSITIGNDGAFDRSVGWRTRVVVRFSSFGSPAATGSVDAPAATDAPPSSPLVYPFGAAVAASLDGRG